MKVYIFTKGKDLFVIIADTESHAREYLNLDASWKCEGSMKVFAANYCHIKRED